MKKSILSKTKLLSTALILTAVLSCVKESVDENADPIVGRWFLTTINGIDVAEVECYNDSYIDADATSITFFIQDREENGDCTTVVDSSEALTIQDDFYFIDEEAIEIYIEGNELTWRVDTESTLIFSK